MRRQHATANSRAFRSESLLLSRRKVSILCESVQPNHSASVKAHLLADLTPRPGPSPAAMRATGPMKVH
jgi:hypothetical protein